MRVMRLATRLAPASGLLVALALATAAPAQADVGETIILRCTHNQSLSGFSQSAYAKALKELSADTEEYSDCAALIRRAKQLAASGGSRSGGSGSAGAAAAAIAATPAESRAIARAAHAAPGPVSVGDGPVRPGVIHASVASAFSSIPSPLLATLAFLAAGLLAWAGHTVRNRVRDGRAR